MVVPEDVLVGLELVRLDDGDLEFFGPLFGAHRPQADLQLLRYFWVRAVRHGDGSLRR